jgi:hypothetical protein
MAFIVTSSDFINLSYEEMSLQIDQLFSDARIIGKNKTIKTTPKNP